MAQLLRQTRQLTSLSDPHRLGRAGQAKPGLALVQKLMKQVTEQTAQLQTRGQPVAPRRWPAAGETAAQVTDPMSSGKHTCPAGERGYRLFLPPAQPQQALALVVMLHGCTQSAEDFALGTRMNDAARRQGFAVLYPEQSTSANPQRCWQWFKHSHQQRGRGEPAILAAMVAEAVASHGLDAQRVFVAGLSAGGAMAAILGQTHPELFAAVGVHSGLPPGAAHDLPSALAAMRSGAVAPAQQRTAPPTIVFHGDADTTVHPLNGQQAASWHSTAGSTVGISQVSAQQPGPATPGGRSATRSIHRDAEGRVQAEHWLVHGAGHAWAGGSAQGSYTDPEGPDATAEMLRFFFQQRPGA